MINRHNYEEYFLLLADKELPPEEEAMVKAFAAQHPDLQEELDILLSCRLDAAPMPLFPKEKLLRTTIWDEETLEPVQTQMLLLLDNELPLAEKQEVESGIAASAALQKEWHTLQQTRLVAEALAHPDKESLYRRERKVRPLVWMRWAAAAMLVGLAFTWWQSADHQSIATHLLVTEPTVTDTHPATVAQASPSRQTTVPKGPVQEPAANPVSTSSNPAPAAQPTSQMVATKMESNRQQAIVEKTKVLVENTDLLATNATTNGNEEDETLPTLHGASVIPVANTDNTTPLTARPSLAKVTVPTTAALPQSEAFTGNKTVLEEEEEEYIRIGTARIRKQKMRGLFRSVTRSVARGFGKSKMEPEAFAANH
jgi:hypothetical protein